MSKLRVVVSGGGTGGHIYPALAIAGGFKDKYDADILYLGGYDSMEERLAKNAGYEFKPITAAPLTRKSIKAVTNLFANGKGYLEAKKILKQWQPNLVVGTGGYASAPVVLAGVALGKATLIHEQNAYPGLANRFLSKKVDAVCLAFDDAKKYFSDKVKTYLTGLPVRSEILQANRQEAYRFFNLDPQRKTVLVTGGSQGAKAINEAFTAAYDALLHQGLQIIHITGNSDYQCCYTKYAAYLQEQEKNGGNFLSNNSSVKDRIVLLSYLDHMEYALAIADVVVGRAGASFLAEVMCCGIPGILVPYPFATANHQELNARALVNNHAAVIIPNGEINSQILTQNILEIVLDQEKSQAMSANAKSMGNSQALDDILKIAVSLIKKKR